MKLFRKKDENSITKSHWRRDEKGLVFVCLILIVVAGLVIGDSFNKTNSVSAATAIATTNAQPATRSLFVNGSPDYYRYQGWQYVNGSGVDYVLSELQTNNATEAGTIDMKLYSVPDNGSDSPDWASKTLIETKTTVSNSPNVQTWSNIDVAFNNGDKVWLVIVGSNTSNVNLNRNIQCAQSANTTLASGITSLHKISNDSGANWSANLGSNGSWRSLTAELANAAPTATTPGSITQATDGFGYVTFTTQIDDGDTDTTKAKIEYSDDGGSSWYDPDLISVTPSQGAIDLDNAETYQAGTNNPIDTNVAATTLTVVWDTMSADNGNGSLDNSRQLDIQVRVTPNDGTVDGSVATSSSFELDNLDPTAAGNLTLNTLATTSLTYDFGVAGSDDNIDHYEVYYKAGASGVATSDTQIGANIASGSYDADATTQQTSLAVNTQYVANIWTYDSLGNGKAATEVVAYTAAAVPGAPTFNNMSLTGGDITLDVNGNPGSTEFAINLDGTAFYVQADGSLGGSAIWQNNATWGTVTISGASANTQYTFKVKARNGDSTETAFGATASAYTLASQVTSVSIADATDKSNYKGTLTWSDNSQSGMKIEQDTDCDASYETTVYDNTAVNETSPYTVTGLAGNTCYQFRISSYNGDGVINSGSIPTSSTITLPARQSTSLSKSDADTNYITWGWTGVAEGTNYKVYRSSDDAYIGETGDASTSYTQTAVTDGGAGLTANTQYTVYVRSISANGTGIASSTASAYTTANLPGSLSHDSASQTTDTMKWTWVSGGAEEYFYAYMMTPSANSGNTNNLYWTVSGTLSANTQYTYYVKAGNGDDVLTSAVNANAYTAQTTPTGMTFSSVGTDSITVTATGSFANIETGSAGIRFQNSTTSSDTTVQTAQWTNSSLSPNVSYTYVVSSLNSDGDETSTVTDSQYTLAAVPGTPTVNNMSTGGGDVTIDVNGNSASTEFAIQESVSGYYIQADGTLGGSAIWQNNAAWGTVTISGASVNTQYTFKVKARNADSTETAFGSTASAYTLANAPGALTVDGSTKTATTVELTIDENSNPSTTEYAIYETTRTEKYVTAGGEMTSDSEVWQTASAWGTVTVIEMSSGMDHVFKIKARNGDSVETAFSDTVTTASAVRRNTTTQPPVTEEIVSRQNTEELNGETASENSEETGEEVVTNIGTISSSTETTPVVTLRRTTTVNFNLSGNGETVHSAEVSSVDTANRQATIILRSDPISVTLDEGESQDVDLDGDGVNDVTVTLLEIVSEDDIKFKITEIEKEVVEVEEVEEGESQEQEELPCEEDLEAAMPDAPEVRDLDKEVEAVKEFIGEMNRLPETDSDWTVVHYLAYGNCEKTVAMTVRARRGILADFVEIYGEMPESGEDWQNLSYIANGEKPKVKALQREIEAMDEFIQLFHRIVDTKIDSEKGFIEQLAYSLRPQERIIDKEKSALGTFINVYNTLPNSGWTWSVIRAIAYSGVK